MRFETSSKFAVLVLAAVSVVGCADPARQRSDRAIGTLDSTRGVMVDGRKQVEAAIMDLDKLSAKPADLTGPFNSFQRDIKAIEDQAGYVRSRVQDMRLRSTEYQTAWERDASQNITDPTLRAQAEQRAARVKEHYDDIDQQAQDVRAAYDPFITELRDLDTFLSNDLTYAGIDTAKPMMLKARASGERLNEKIDAVVNSLSDTTAKLSPTTAPLP